MSDPTREGGPVDPKIAAREQIAQAVHDAGAADFNAFNEETGEIIPNAPAAEAPADEPAGEPQVEQQAADEPQPEPAKPETLTIIVNGQPVEVNRDQVIEAGKRTLQKETAADKKLQEAAEIYRRAQLYASQTRPAPSEQDAQTTSPATSVDPEALISQLDQRWEQKLIMREAARAEDTFKKEFADIVSDPDLWAVVLYREQQRIQHATAVGEPLGDPLEAYRAHGKYVRDKLMKHAPVQVTDKTEAKRSMVAIGGVNAKAPAPKDDKPETVQDIIKGLRQTRLAGRPIPIRPNR